MSLLIVSGGQTGVDRGALDAAIALGLHHGGWCPKGRRAEDGRIPDRYQLQETASADYTVRTHLNVHDAAGTLIVVPQLPLTGGTRLTERTAQQLRRPCLVVALDVMHWRAPGPSPDVSPGAVAQWITELAEARDKRDYSLLRINVAGPRESKVPGIQAATAAFLTRVLAEYVPQK